MNVYRYTIMNRNHDVETIMGNTNDLNKGFMFERPVCSLGQPICLLTELTPIWEGSQNKKKSLKV